MANNANSSSDGAGNKRNLSLGLPSSKKFTKAAGGLALGTTAGLISLAANIADGDLFENPSKAFGEIAGSTAVGYQAGSALTGKLYKKEGATGGVDKEAFYNSEEYAAMSENSEIQRICQEKGITIEQATDTFLDNGIDDPEVIKEALENEILGSTYMIYKNYGVTEISDIANAKEKYPKMEDAALASMVMVSKQVKEMDLNEFKSMCRNKNLTGTYLDTDDKIEEAYNKLINL